MKTKGHSQDRGKTVGTNVLSLPKKQSGFFEGVGIRGKRVSMRGSRGPCKGEKSGDLKNPHAFLSNSPSPVAWERIGYY